MFRKLVSRNADLRRLVDKGYAIAFDNGFLVVRDIPYLNQDRKLQTGAIVTKLDFVDEEQVAQHDHTVFFAGNVPHGLDGKPIPNLGGEQTQLALSESSKDVVVQRSFSNRPKSTGKFDDFFHKIEGYVNIISGPAMELHGASPYTFRAVKEVASSTIFKFQDTLTSRAEIMDLSARFAQDVVAVIGVGGTGAYLLDFLVKTPVKEIRVFDQDCFHVHNAYRSPGSLDPAELSKPKVEVYSSRYDNFRHGLIVNRKRIDASCADDLNGVTFAFVCVDKGTSRAGIFDLLLSRGIPFIDVGMGLIRKNDRLNGMMRTTYFSAEHGPKVRAKELAPLTDSDDDLYKTNIQISELNALNACFAIIKFKQVRGFYSEEPSQYNLLFEVRDCGIVRETRID